MVEKMKVILFASVLTLTSGAKLDKTYLPPSTAQISGGSGDFLRTPKFPGSGIPQRPNFQGTANVNNFSRGSKTDFNNDAVVIDSAVSNNDDFGSANNFNNLQRGERPQSSFERNAAILRQDSMNDGQGYSFTYETENGIFAEESGTAADGVEAQGGFSYTGDDGQVYSIRYTADQNGFVPQGDHLPTPPPVPEEILRALEQNARDEASGIFDDGSYDARKYNGAEENFNSQQYNNGNTRNSFNEYNNSQNNGYLPPKNVISRNNQNVGPNQRFENLSQNFDSRRRSGFNSNNGYSY